MKNQITLNKRRLFIEYSEFSDMYRGDTCIYESDYKSLIGFLKRGGFKIRTPQRYKGEYKCLAKYHKTGFKNDVFVLIEKQGRGISLQFGNIKNLWDCEGNSWDWESDERYYHPTYLEKCRISLEILRASEFMGKKLNVVTTNTDDSLLSAEQYIIKNLKNNTHIHGVVTCLEDIAKDINVDSYDYKCNSNDRDNNKILCGQKKYFYDYNGKICCGIVWHHINNMWWVICGKELRNVAAFHLFDYNGDPKKKPAETRKIENLIQKYSSAFQFKKAEAIYRQHKSLIQLSA